MAASSSGLLVSGLRAIALPLALSIAVFAPLGCSDDPPSLGEDGDLCDPIDAPCKRTQVCEGGTCVNAQRCPEGESSECPEADGDDDPLFCEYTFCVEACQTGGKHCPPPQFRCDLISKTCVPNDDTCRTNEDCVDGKLCHILEGDDTGQCIVGEPCGGDGECAESIYGPFCHPTEKFCVSCFEDAQCAEGVRTICNPETNSCDRPPPKECLDDIECCPPDKLCQMTCDLSRDPSVCVEGLNCLDNDDCLKDRGRYCFDEDANPDTPGQCRTSCIQGGACPIGFDCNGDGECEQTECTSDDDCDPPAKCIEFADGKSFCRDSECTIDTDCVDQGRGCTCDELVPGFGKCQDCACDDQGQEGACAEPGWVCDVDPNAGENFIHCQEPCQDRGAPQCPIDSFCDVEGGTGLCRGVTGELGCMTSESCAEGNECCNRESIIPLCGAGACGLNPCRYTASCAEGQLCVDDECVASEERPTICEGSDECAGRQVCANAGACELASLCQGDQDCPGRLTCSLDTGRCNECETDGDCLSAGVGVVCGDAPSGRYRKCLEPAGGFCEDDSQCTGNRTCNQGFCGPDPEFQCEDDWMDRAFANESAQNARPPVIGNHSALQAAPLGAQTTTGLILCDGRDDWFSVDLEQGQDVEVTLIYDVNGGTGADLSLELREGNTLYGRSDSMGGVERVGINGAPFDGTFFIRVAGVPGASATPYNVTLKVGEICVDDPFEGPEGNEQSDKATSIEPGLVPDLILCQPDGEGSSVDVYALDFDAGTNATLVVSWDEADGRIEGGLFDRDGAIDDAANVSKQEFGDSIRWDVSEWGGGSMFLRLSSDAGNDSEIRYDIRVLAECSPGQRSELCAEAPALPLLPGPLGPAGTPEFFEVSLSGNTCTNQEIGNCFSGSCDPLGEEHVAKEMIWKLDTTVAPFNGTQPVEVNVRYQVDDDWRGTVSFRSGCEDDAGEASCRLDPRRPYRETLIPGVHNILVDGSGEDCGPFTLDLTVRPLDIDIHSCDTCVSLGGSVCDLGNPDDYAPLALATWENIGGDAGDDFNYVLQLRDTTALSTANQFEGGVASCIDVANARFSPDTVYQFTTPEGAPDGCRFTARLAARNFVGGLALRDDCPAQNEQACKFANNFTPKVLFLEELESGTYTLWVKGSGALQSGDFTLDLQCTPPGGDPPGNTCDDPVAFEMDPLVDHAGFQLGHVKEALVGQNIGASDEGDHGSACRAEACDPDVEGDCGGDIWYSFNQPKLANVWFAELQADYPATFTVYRGLCDGLEEVACGNTGEAINLFDFPAGEYFIVVDGEGNDARGGHQLDITSIEEDVVQPPNDACHGEYANPGIRAADIGFDIGRRVQIDGSTFGANHDRNPQNCGDPDADARDVVFVYTADQEHNLEARIFGGFEHNLYVRRADCLNGPEVVCAEGDIEETNLNAGTYYIFVDGLTSEQQGGFTLQVTFLPPLGECPQEDGGNCEDAQEIVLEENEPGLFQAEFIGNNGSCANSETPPDGCGQANVQGVDTVYYFDLPTASRVDIITDAIFDEVSYLRRADDADGCALAVDIECADNDPARIAPADALPAGRYYLVVDAEFEDARLGPVTIIIRAEALEDPPANDTCAVVLEHGNGLQRFLDGDANVLALPEECQEEGDDDPAANPLIARCGLLDGLLAAGDGQIVIGGDTSASLPNYDVRDHDPDNDSTCEADGGLRAADEAKDVVYRFTAEVDSSLTVAFNNIDLGNGLISLRPADAGGCGGEAADSELHCGDEPPSLDIETLQAGTYYLIVNGFNAAAAGQFTLDIDLQPKPVRPVNDHCHPQVANQDATDILLNVDEDAGTATGQLDGTLIAAADDYQPSSCDDVVFGLGTGPDVVYALDLPFDNNEVEIEIETARLANNSAEFNLIAYMRSGVCHDGPEIPGSCSIEGNDPPDPSIDLSFANRRFLPGNQVVWLVVDGFGEDDEADNFQLRVNITEVEIELAEGNSCDADDIPTIAFDGEEGAEDEQVRQYNGESTVGNTNVTSTDNCGGGDGNDRVHRLVVPQDSLVDVIFTPDGWAGSVSIRGVDACDDNDAEVTCGGNQIGPVTLTAGDYWLWVDGNSDDDWGPYTLQAHKVPVILTPQNDTCALVAQNDVLWNDGDPDAEFPAICAADPSECGVVDFGDNERAVLSHGLNDEGTDEEEGSCGGIGGRERIYKISLPDPSFLTITTQFTLPRLKVYMRGVCADPDSEVVLDADANPPDTLCDDARRGVESIIQTPQLAAGDYYLVVDGRTADDLGDYTVVVSRNASPPNDDCDGAITLDIGRGGQAGVNGNTGVAGHDYEASCGGADAEDVVYAFNLEGPADVSINVSTAFDSAISLRSAACDPEDEDGEETHCIEADLQNAAQIEVENMQPGEYWLHIDGRGDGDSGGFAVNIQAVPLTPPNNECADAEAIDFGIGGIYAGSGTLIGATNDDGGPNECSNNGPDVFYTYAVEVTPKDFMAKLLFGSDERCSGDNGAGAPGDEECGEFGCCPDEGEVCIDPDENGVFHCEIADARFDHYMFTRAPDCGAALECGATSQALLLPDVAPGEYTLVVDGAEPGNRGDFTLRAETLVPGNSDCLAVAEAGSGYDFVVTPDADPDDEVVPTWYKEGSLVGAGKSYRRVLDECTEDNTDGTRDVVYELTLAEPLDSVDVTVTSRHFNPIFWANFDNCAAGEPYGCWVGDDDDGDGVWTATATLSRLQAGRHFLIIDGGAPDALGEFTVKVEAGAVLTPPENVDCEHAEEIVLDYTNTIPIEGTGEVIGSTIGSTSTYAPASCDGADAAAIELMAESADVVYCILMDTKGNQTTGNIILGAAPGGLPFFPTGYLYVDTNGYDDSRAACSEDFGVADCGDDGCCPEAHPLCKDYDFDGDPTCQAEPSCADPNVNSCGAGNPLLCGAVLNDIQVGVGAIDEEAQQEQPEGAETPEVYKYFLIVDGQGDQGDFNVDVRTTSQVAVCDGPINLEDACDAEAGACCADDLVCRCPDLDIRPCDDVTDLDCCANDAENPPTCLACARNEDCEEGEVCKTDTFSCEPGCEDDAGCEAPTWCFIEDGEPDGQCIVCENTDAPAGGDCADDDDCEQIADRAQFCGPSGKCSECGVNNHGTNNVCNGANLCVTCSDDAHCAGIENAAGDPLTICQIGAGACVECANGDECDGDADCPDGTVCGGGFCVACDAGEFCNAQGTCAECSVAPDCDEGEICQNGICQEQGGPPGGGDDDGDDG